MQGNKDKAAVTCGRRESSAAARKGNVHVGVVRRYLEQPPSESTAQLPPFRGGRKHERPAVKQLFLNNEQRYLKKNQ